MAMLPSPSRSHWPRYATEDEEPPNAEAGEQSLLPIGRYLRVVPSADGGSDYHADKTTLVADAGVILRRVKNAAATPKEIRIFLEWCRTHWDKEAVRVAIIEAGFHVLVEQHADMDYHYKTLLRPGVPQQAQVLLAEHARGETSPPFPPSKHNIADSLRLAAQANDKIMSTQSLVAVGDVSVETLDNLERLKRAGLNLQMNLIGAQKRTARPLSPGGLQTADGGTLAALRHADLDGVAAEIEKLCGVATATSTMGPAQLVEAALVLYKQAVDGVRYNKADD